MPKRRLNLLFVLLIVLTVILIISSKLGIINSAAGFVQNSIAPIQTSVRGLFFKDINSKNSKTLEFASKLVDQKKLVEDNEALRNQFETITVKTQSLIPARIVGSPSFIPGISVPEYLILDVGKQDGVEDGYAVISKDNLIGVIEKANDNFSKVVLVNSSSFSSTAKTLKEQSAGVINGNGAEQMILDNVLLSQKLTINDLVVTRGSLNENGEGIAPNLIIGKITSVNKSASDLFQTAKVEPLIETTSLSTVFVIVKQ